MKLRIAICDDEEKARDNLRIELEKLMDERSDEIVYEFSNGSTCANWVIAHPGEIDVLFLDVEMEKENGIDTARRIRNGGSNIFIVFVTGYTDYVYEGYRVEALDYLTKPVSRERLQEVLSRVKMRLKPQTEKAFVFKNGDGMYRMPYDDILYFYSDRRYVNLVTAAKTYTFYGKLNEVEERVGKTFLRIHQRYLVNGDKVAFLANGHLAVKDLDGERLPISRAYRETVLERLARNILGETGAL